jgi:hypothetical protein
MKTYILLLFDKDRQVTTVRALAAETQAQAAAEAHTVAAGKDELSSYELWNGGRKVAMFSATRRDNTPVGQSSQI